MKLITLLAAACFTAGFAVPEQVNPRALITIEVAPGESREITEEERWELSSVSSIQRFALFEAQHGLLERRLWESLLRHL